MTKFHVLLVAISVIVVAVLWVLFKNVFSGHSILPQTFSIGPFVIRYYGLCMAIAVLAGFYLAQTRAPRYGMKSAQAEDFIFYLIVCGFVGARLYHVLSSAGYYMQYPLDVFKVWNGGLSIYGAVAGGVVAVFVFARRYNLQALRLLDWLTPSLLLGQIIGRFGNLFNYELFGYPTKLPWKMFVPAAFRPESFVSQAYFHPLFLYEALMNAVILIVLLFFYERKFGSAVRPGTLFFWYLLLYNAGRFFLEFLRIDSVFIGTIRINAIVSALAVAVCVLFIFVKTNKSAVAQ